MSALITLLNAVKAFFRDEIVRYRLAPTETNLVLREFIKSLGADIAVPLDQPIRFNHNNQDYVLFPVCKDAETESNEKNLEFVGKQINDYIATHDVKNCILLSPLFFCRGYLKAHISISFLKRKHATLLMIDMHDNPSIKIFDSQGYVRKFFYPDKMINIADKKFAYDPSRDYFAYGVQEGPIIFGGLLFADVISCGYYMIEYFKHLITTGSHKGFEAIKLDVRSEFSHKWEYFKSLGVDIPCPPEFENETKRPSKATVMQMVDDFVCLEDEPKPELPVLTFEIEDDQLRVSSDGMFKRTNSLPSIESSEQLNPKIKCTA